MARINGKKPTVAQFKAMEKFGVENVKEWLFKGIKYESPDGLPNLSKNEEVSGFYLFVNRNTGEELKVPV